MKLPRLFGWLIATLLLLSLIWLLAPQQLGVSLYKLSLVTTAGVVGYWLDRSLFPYARPDKFIVHVDPEGARCDPETKGDCKQLADDPFYDDAPCYPDIGGDCKLLHFDLVDGDGFVFALAMLRRAIIVGCAMLAMGLGA